MYKILTVLSFTTVFSLSSVALSQTEYAQDYGQGGGYYEQTAEESGAGAYDSNIAYSAQPDITWVDEPQTQAAGNGGPWGNQAVVYQGNDVVYDTPAANHAVQQYRQNIQPVRDTSQALGRCNMIEFKSNHFLARANFD